MSKATPLNPGIMGDVEHEKTLKPREIAAKPTNTKSKAKKSQGDQTPLQIRIPKSEVKAIKLAAIKSDMTISDFMLACFHEHMKK